ncbi:hypothetical protein X801_03320 [Opisthorchis viverrini]|uniref:Uncharacterized protein n=1 Tax=Opisthorchis viverrini TaxID=6198 RepID=A0A1S8X252_OPIVI|nr:hypothetical protein X801_03320 [Opisthorchis viverrini]
MSTSIWRLGSKSTHHIRRDSKGELCMHWWCSHATDIIYLYASHTRKSILLDARLRTRRLAISASISQGRKNVPHALKVLPLFVSHQNRQQTHKTR